MSKESIKKYLVLKPEVNKIFEDLESYLNFCRFELLNYNPADLYNRASPVWNQYYYSTRPARPRKEDNRREFNRSGSNRSYNNR